MTTISLRKASPAKTRTDAVVIGVHRSGNGLRPTAEAREVSAAFGRRFETLLGDLGFTGKLEETRTMPTRAAIRSPLLVVVGLGEQEHAAPETIRRAAGAAVRAVHKAESVAFALPTPDDEHVNAIAEGVLLGSYRFERYRRRNGSTPVADAVILTERARSESAKDAVATAEVVAEAVNLTRDWVNMPPGDFYPEAFAEQISSQPRPDGVACRVLDEKALKTNRCGGILGVGAGSTHPPRMVELTYRPRRPVAHLGLVGKGITFDSGGLSLKPGSSMMTMKCDMAGAAAVVAATMAVARLELPVRLTTYACIAENMPAGGATRPGDVLSMRNGTTVEVLNTDAEGRLVLADGLVMASEAAPDLIVDVATLTGACHIALGGRYAGVMANDERLLDTVPAAATRAGENLWPLPIPEEMLDKVTSSRIADLCNHNPDKSGGALYAAAFLREFVGDGIRWAHLDIAGPAFNDGSAYGYTPKSGTGFGVRTLVQLARQAADGDLP